MPVIESRYAEAFLGSVPTAEAADGVERALTGLSGLWRDNEEFRFFMLNPVVPDNAKKETVMQILREDAEANPILKNFIYLLIDKERLTLLPEISDEFSSIKSKSRNGITITVTSAETLDGGQMEGIREKYRAQYGAAYADIQNIVEPSLIGGVRVQIGDMLIDNTLSDSLKNLLLAIE